MRNPKKPPYFPMEVDAFLADEAIDAMSPLALGAFVRLMLKSWSQTPPCTVPADDQWLASRARMTADSWSGLKQEVLSPFRTCGVDRLILPWLRAKYDHAQHVLNIRTANGKLKKSISSANASISISSSLVSSPVVSSESEKTAREQAGEPPGALNTPEFRQLWADYERFRAQDGQKPLPSMSVVTVWANLDRIGHERALAAIRATIAGAWKNIREPDNGRKESNGVHNGSSRKAQFDAAQKERLGGMYAADDRPLPT